MIDVLLGFDPAMLAAFVVAGLVLNLTPGADFVFVSASGISGGPGIGMAAALGVNLGVLVHVLAGAAGLSAVLLAYPAAYDAIRFAGAAYLVWLAVQAWRSTGGAAAGNGALSFSAAVRRGFLTNVLNPKTALFIFAFIPQFTDPVVGPLWMQMLILGAIFQLNGMVFSLGLGAAAGWLAVPFRARLGVLNKLTALIFGGLAARLVWA